jgi:hypothetical protein
MSSPKLPWEQGWTPPAVDPDLVKKVQEMAGAATPPVITFGGGGGGGATVGSGATVKVTPTGGSSDWGAVVEKAAEASLQQALPVLRQRVTQTVVKTITDELTGLGPAPIAHIDHRDLTKLDAWERAARTFGVGLVVTVLGALVQVIGMVTTDGTNIDWFHRDGWTAVGGLAVSAILGAVGSYIARYLKEPVGASLDSSDKGNSANTS